MKRRNFLTKSTLATGVFASGLTTLQAQPQPAAKELYELRIYELRWGSDALDNYLSKALIPALNRLGVKRVGAFSQIGDPEPKKIYLLIPYASFEDYGRIVYALKTDKEFGEASASYNRIPQGQAVYDRFESSISVAFDGLPQMPATTSGSRIFELRTYEGYSEDAVTRKVKMFNDGEFRIFDQVKLNPVFFGETIAGNNLPCLTYMIWFKDMEERDRNWKAFIEHPDWKKMSADPAYADTVSKIHKVFLKPASYSQV